MDAIRIIYTSILIPLTSLDQYLPRIPQYRQIMLAIKDGLESVAFDIEHGANPDGVGRRSVIKNFNQRRHKKAESQGEKARAKAKLWDKKEGKKVSPTGGSGGESFAEVVDPNRADLYEVANSDDDESVN